LDQRRTFQTVSLRTPLNRGYLYWRMMQRLHTSDPAFMLPGARERNKVEA
jgi:hypothetical protein